jgi:hypothetical protein
MREDEQHLQLLAIFHFILGGLYALCGCFPLVYVFAGGMVISAAPPPKSPNEPPPEVIGVIFIALGLFLCAMIWIIAICTLLSGRFIMQRKYRTFCLVTAGLMCLNAPQGTVLGVFTFIVLLRPSVTRLFDGLPPIAPVYPDQYRPTVR